jgi:hypothetical protein
VEGKEKLTQGRLHTEKKDGKQTDKENNPHHVAFYTKLDTTIK